MLEKNSSIVLTEEEIRLYNAGIVSERLKEVWGLNLSDLSKLVAQQQITTKTTKDVNNES